MATRCCRRDVPRRRGCGGSTPGLERVVGPSRCSAGGAPLVQRSRRSPARSSPHHLTILETIPRSRLSSGDREAPNVPRSCPGLDLAPGGAPAAPQPQMGFALPPAHDEDETRRGDSMLTSRSSVAPVRSWDVRDAHDCLESFTQQLSEWSRVLGWPSLGPFMAAPEETNSGRLPARYCAICAGEPEGRRAQPAQRIVLVDLQEPALAATSRGGPRGRSSEDSLTP